MKSNYATITQAELAHDLVSHDPLATDRTYLANERTFLAYIRTAMTVLVAGFSLIEFFEASYIQYVGWFSLVPAAFLFYKGYTHYYSLKRSLKV